MADDKNLIGQSFDNPALTGSGTIMPDGTYGPNLPDPTEVRGLGPDKTSGGRLASLVNLDPIPDALIVDKDHSTAATAPEETKSTTTGTPAKKSTTTR